jgi:hypothetical protein
VLTKLKLRHKDVWGNGYIGLLFLTSALVQIESVVMTYISSFINICSRIKEVHAVDSEACKQYGSLISLLMFIFQFKENWLKIKREWRRQTKETRKI